MCHKWILDYNLPMDTKSIFNKIISHFLKVHLFVLSEHNGILVFQMPSCIFLEDLKKVPSLCLCWDVVQLSLNLCSLARLYDCFWRSVCFSSKSWSHWKTINLLSVELMSFGIVYLSCDIKTVGAALVFFSG